MNPHFFSTCGIIIHWSIAILLSVRVIVRRLPASVAMAWVVVICAVPFIGSILYIIVGEKRLGRARQARINTAFGKILRWGKEIKGSVPDPQMAERKGGSIDRHAERITGLPALGGNQLTLLHGFDASTDSLIADLELAKESIALSYYILHEGGRANDIFNALEQAAQRGVEVRVIGDCLGSKAFFKSNRVKQMRKAGVKIVEALPTGLYRSLFVRFDLRNHRKILVIDNRIAYTGSQNLVDPRFFKQDAGVGQWVDAVTRIQGPVVSSLAAVFECDWSAETGAEWAAPKPSPPAPSSDDQSVIQVFPSGPGWSPEAIRQILLEVMYTARKELVLTTPYFVPDDTMLTAIVSAAMRDVDVTLLVPGHNDSKMVRYASASTYSDLMDAGVHIAMYQDGLLHTKSITIDRELSIFGSVNLDMRSLWINFEISLLIYDPKFTARLREVQQGYIDASQELDAEKWSKRPLRHVLAEDSLRLLGPLL
jgi:cardiolipin synthase